MAEAERAAVSEVLLRAVLRSPWLLAHVNHALRVRRSKRGLRCESEASKDKRKKTEDLHDGTRGMRWAETSQYLSFHDKAASMISAHEEASSECLPGIDSLEILGRLLTKTAR